MTDLTLEQQAAMTAGAAMWRTMSYPDAGIPELTLGDGPMGIASGRVDERDVSLLTPCPTALGASWDLKLIERVGALVGGDAVRRGVDMVLAPNVNLARSPLAGRAFEYFSEDPFLTGCAGGAWVTGVQSTGTAACAKHLVCNDSETARDTMNAVIDERSLREVYMLPFEICVEAGVAGIMAAYNRINGDWCAEAGDVLTIVKSEWKFDGVTMSDWFGTHSTAATLNAGLDLEMPGPARFLGRKAIGAVPAKRIADAAERLTAVARRFGGDKATPMAADAAQNLLVEAAAAGCVLLRNEDDFLPLSPGRHPRIAVIGPNAATPCYQGGTFAKIAVSPNAIRPLDAIRARYGTRARIDYEPGVDPQPRLPSMPTMPARDLGDGCAIGMTVDYFDGESDTPVVSETRATNSLVWFAGVHDDTAVLGRPARIVSRGIFTAAVAGDYIFYLGATGRVVMRIDGHDILRTEEDVPSSDVMGRLKSGDAESVIVALSAGQQIAIEIEFRYAPARVHGLWYGIRCPDSPAAMLARAVDLARSSDAVILIVGETSDASVESKDRVDTRLAPEQVALIEAVTAANPNTAIVANVGHAFDTSWDHRARALLLAWYPGEAFGSALAEVLAGDREPGGRMPVSIAASDADYPALSLTPHANGDLVYAEGTRIGYRSIAHPRHAFGSGRGYARISIGDACATKTGNGWVIEVSVTNASERAGSEVVQVYRSHPELTLVGFAKVHLHPGETRAVTIAIAHRRLQIWNDGWTDLRIDSLWVGRSATDINHVVPLE